MKLLIVFSLSVCLFAAAEVPAKKRPPAKAAASSANIASNLQIPATAIKGDDGSYRYTDPQGKKWIYRKTPFGTAHFEDKPAAARTDDSAKLLNEMKASEDGETIRFERPGPFGNYKWQRKKTELDEMEQTVWNRDRARTARKD